MGIKLGTAMKSKLMKRFSVVEKKSPTKPIDKAEAAILNSTFVWTNGADVATTWRRYGWVPPTEYRNDYLFKKNRELVNE